MPNNLSGILRQVLTVPAQSIKTIDFKDKQPNYFHIQNIGTGTIYFSVHGMPTNSYYDMKIDGGSIATFTDTYSQPEAFIYNPGMESVNVILLTFSAPFDPAVLAQANKQISIGGTVETDGIVKGFQTSLPSGSNKIGNVGVTSALPTGSNKIGKVELTGTTADNLVSKMNEVSTKLDNLKFDIGAVAIEDVRIKDESEIFIQTYNLQDVQGIDIVAPEGRYFSKLIKIYNAEDVDMFLGDYFDENYISNIPIVNNDFDINAKSTYNKISLMSTNGTKSKVVFIAETKPYKTETETYTETAPAYGGTYGGILTYINPTKHLRYIKITSDIPQGYGYVSKKDGTTWESEYGNVIMITTDNIGAMSNVSTIGYSNNSDTDANITIEIGYYEV